MAYVNKSAVIEKIIGMFRPVRDERFLNFDGADVICGPNDRAIIGVETYFPKQWLIEDYDFTEAEADWFVAEVKRLARTESPR